MSSSTTPADNGPSPAPAAGASSEQQSNDIGLDSVFEVLKNSRRRRVLGLLHSAEEPVPLDRVTEHVAAVENDTTPAQLSSRERKRAYVGLYQCHLPKMDGLDVVEFDKEAGEVALGANAALLDPYLGVDADDGPNWPVYYLALSVGGITTLAGLLVAGLVTPTLSAAVAGLVLALFAVLSCAQLYY